MLLTERPAMQNHLAGLFKEGIYLMSGLTVFGFLQPLFSFIHSLLLVSWLMPLLDSKVGAAFVAGCFMLLARRLETRWTSSWRARALKAEADLGQTRDVRHDGG